MTPTPSIFSKVLPYKLEAYCSTNGRCTVGFPFLQGLEAREVQRYKWGGVLPYKLEVFCSTFSETSTLQTLTSLNKEVRPFFLGDNSIWRFPSVSFPLAIPAFGGPEG